MSHAREARQLLRAHFYGVLSTHSARFEGYPFGSIVPYLTDYDGSVIVFISALAEHTKNVARNPRVSLITHDQNDPCIQTQGRITLIGRIELVPSRATYAARWLRHFPDAAQLFELGDFAFYRIIPEAARHVAGFGQARWISGHFTVAPYPLMEEVESLIIHINSEFSHLIKDCLHHQCISPHHWQLIDIDHDGATVMADQRLVRLVFPALAVDGKSALGMLQQLAKTSPP